MRAALLFVREHRDRFKYIFMPKIMFREDDGGVYGSSESLSTEFVDAEIYGY